jgi:hypothetical protein
VNSQGGCILYTVHIYRPLLPVSRPSSTEACRGYMYTGFSGQHTTEGIQVTGNSSQRSTQGYRYTGIQRSTVYYSLQHVYTHPQTTERTVHVYYKTPKSARREQYMVLRSTHELSNRYRRFAARGAPDQPYPLIAPSPAAPTSREIDRYRSETITP